MNGTQPYPPSVPHAARTEPVAQPPDGRPLAADFRPAGPRVWSLEELLGDNSEATIMHGDQAYRLRKTRNGKLILFK